MPFNELFDETLDINSTVNYKLSIQGNLDGFYFSLLDTLRNKYVLFRSYEPDEDKKFSIDQLSVIISDDDFLNRQYAATYIIIPTQKSTVVPSQLYDPAGKDDYFGLNIPLNEGETIRVNRLKYPDAYLLFSVNSELTEFFNKRFPGCEPTHNLKPLLHYLLTGKISQGDNLLHLHVEDDYIIIVNISESRLKLCNTFSYRNTSDLMYYLLYVAKKSNMTASSTLTVSGSSVRFDEIWTGLSEYIGNIKYATPGGNSLFSYVFSEEIMHRHLNLFTIAYCV